MGWVEKEKVLAIDQHPVDGLYYLDGDVFARRIGREWTKGLKYPTIVFPSGMQCDLWEHTQPDNATVHLFGEMDLPLRDTREMALTKAEEIAEACGYLVRARGEEAIEVFGTDDEYILITYDGARGMMSNVQALPPSKVGERPVPELLDAKSRAKLPPLYSNEKLGLEALAQVKFFTPDSFWSWYASEFDGDNTFFGLVSGFEVERGYFLYSELKAVRGPLGLPVERDRYFEPTTLRDLRDKLNREHFDS